MSEIITPTPQALALAHRIWRERQATYPAFTRRMMPDEIDHATGAWARVVFEAIDRLAHADQEDPEAGLTPDLFAQP